MKVPISWLREFVDVPAAATGPCGDQRSVLAGGVDKNELSRLDKTVKALNTALGLDPPPA